MTAETAGHVVVWSPDPIRQRLANYILEDVVNLPGDAPRVELRDGVMIVVPSPSIDHQTIGSRLWMWLAQHAPHEFLPVIAVGVAVGVKDTVEPDVLLIDREVETKNHFVLADQVTVAVEIVSPGTKRRDRLEKPMVYAAAGIPHFWRIEQDPLHVFAYDLENGSYRLVAEASIDTDLVLSAPFEIALPIRDIAP